MEDDIIHVAFADDHTSIRTSIISALEQLGGLSFIMQAGNGVELLEKLGQAEQLPDICILDINMPVMNGFDTLKEIKRRWPEMQTLAYSIYNDDAHILKMLALGANGYLVKSCEATEIRQALEEIYYNGYYYSRYANAAKFSAVNSRLMKTVHLTLDEKTFLQHCCKDITYSEIASLMQKTERSVEGIRQRLCRKFNVKTRAGLIMSANQHGLGITNC